MTFHSVSQTTIITNFISILLLLTNIGQAAPTVEEALKLAPVQISVDYDIPSEQEVKHCDLETSKSDNGWILVDGSSRKLRRFLDTDGDNQLDQWCYYKDGIEVYRDIDSNKNGRADQYRWLSTAGTRWGIDNDEDGKIDSWKHISPEELSAEAIESLRTGNRRRFKALLLSQREIRALGLTPDLTRQLKSLTAAAVKKFKAPNGTDSLIPADARWVNFSATQPGLVPAGSFGTTSDLTVYENAVAMFQSNQNHGQLFLGTLIRVGNAWRMVQLPQNLNNSSQPPSSGLFFSATVASDPSDAATGPAYLAGPDQKLLDELEEIDKLLGDSTGTSSVTQLNARRCKILEMIIDTTTENSQRTNWIRQLADTLSAAVQASEFPDGTLRLEELIKRLETSSNDSTQVPYVKFRYLSANYAQNIQDPNAEFSKVQEQWLDELKDYIDEFPDSQDTAEAMLQLAIAEEFAGNDEQAKTWYSRIIKTSHDTLLSQKSTGAQKRLDSVGQLIRLKGQTLDGNLFNLSSYRGKVIALHYWATWCEPCLRDMKQLKRLQAQYGSQGFVPVGVNLDSQQSVAAQFLKDNRYPWPQLHEDGGLDSRFANELGILTLPTMLLVDQQGRVINRNLHVAEIEDLLEKILK